MSVRGTYLDMPLSIDDLDGENLAYFQHCAEHDFHLQQCDDCKLLRYPPTTAMIRLRLRPTMPASACRCSRSGRR